MLFGHSAQLLKGIRLNLLQSVFGLIKKQGKNSSETSCDRRKEVFGLNGMDLVEKSCFGLTGIDSGEISLFGTDWIGFGGFGSDFENLVNQLCYSWKGGSISKTLVKFVSASESKSGCGRLDFSFSSSFSFSLASFSFAAADDSFKFVSSLGLSELEAAVEVAVAEVLINSFETTFASLVPTRSISLPGIGHF
jgi:hypothetical protein